jgi:DNA polymerase elongation subunit (family B)
MIVDWFHPDFDKSEPPHIYERTRGEDGILHENLILPEDEGYVMPFCWVREDINPRLQSRVCADFPRTNFHFDEQAEGIDGVPLIKMTTVSPDNLWEIKNRIPTYEADISYQDQYIITRYPDGIPEFFPRIWYYDLEWDVKEGFTTVMAVVDTYEEHPVVFAWREGQEDTIEWIDRYDGYLLHLYGSEMEMHEGFLRYLDKCNPDILVAHAGNWADLPHLVRRLDNHHRLSPLLYMTPLREGGKDFYDDVAQPIRGRLVYDSAARGMTGSGFESIWQKSGKGQMSSRKLNWIANELELGEKLTNRIKGMTVFNGWGEYFDEFVDYCLVDATLLRDIDQKLHAIEFQLAMQKLCGVSFPSTCRVTRYFRGLIGRRTSYKAPSSKAIIREDLQAAYIPKPKAGRHSKVGLFDYESLYPNIIISDNLSWETKRRHAGDGIKTIGNGTHWDQSERGLLPSIVLEMLALRGEYKTLMKNAKSEDERRGFDMLQTATKVAVNAVYGMVAMKKIGGMWSDLDIGKTITYRGRESIKFLMSESEKLGYTPLYGHTDSAFIQVPFDEAQALADHLTQAAREQLDMIHLNVELETYFDYWTSTETKNRYFGIKTWPKEEAGKMKVTGFELKAANAAPISKMVQDVAFNLIGTGATEEQVNAAIYPIIKAVEKGEISIEDLAPYGRVKKAFSDYQTVVPMAARAAKYYNDNMTPVNPFRQGDGAQWVYISNTPEDMPNEVVFPKRAKNLKANVIAFREASEIQEFPIDYDVIIVKMIHRKLESVYNAMGWELKNALAASKPARW